MATTPQQTDHQKPSTTHPSGLLLVAIVGAVCVVLLIVALSMLF